jgi:hypothetical protein
MAYSARSNMELIYCPDCLALSESGKCKWLNLNFCVGEECAFMKTDASYSSQQQKTYARLATLDEDIQARISMMYYDGARPWIQAEREGGYRILNQDRK